MKIENFLSILKKISNIKFLSILRLLIARSLPDEGTNIVCLSPAASNVPCEWHFGYELSVFNDTID